jgi:hypothetical protein
MFFKEWSELQPFFRSLFSRADKANKMIGALAPEGSFSKDFAKCGFFPQPDQPCRLRIHKHTGIGRLQHFRFCSLQKPQAQVAFSSRKGHLARSDNGNI